MQTLKKWILILVSAILILGVDGCGKEWTVGKADEITKIVKNKITNWWTDRNYF